jgi:hypothetical protein
MKKEAESFEGIAKKTKDENEKEKEMKATREMMSKFSIAFVLVLVLSISMLPAVAFGTDDAATTAVTTEASIDDDNNAIALTDEEGAAVENELAREATDAENAVTEEAKELEEKAEGIDWDDYWWVLLLPLLGLLAWWFLRRPKAEVKEVAKPVAIVEDVEVEDEIKDERYV